MRKSKWLGALLVAQRSVVALAAVLMLVVAAQGGPGRIAAAQCAAVLVDLLAGPDRSESSLSSRNQPPRSAPR